MITTIHTRRKHNNVFNRVTILSIQIVVSLLVLFIQIQQQQNNYNVYVSGYPTGAGTCIGNVPAVTDTPHLNPLLHSRINGGTLTDAGIIVQVTSTNDVTDEIELISNRELQTATFNDSSTTTNNNEFRELYVNTNYTISVIGTMYAYKGYLLRVQGLETQSSSCMKNSLSKGKNTKVIGSTTCNSYSKVSALTHSNNEFKQQHTGTIYLNETGLIQLDITIVGVNNKTISLYAYDNFTINFISKPPVSTPVTTPVTKPVTTPVTKPVSVPFAQMATPEPVSTAPVLIIDEQYVKSIVNDTVNDIVVQLYNITSGISTTGTTLSLDDLITVQATINLWFTQFYNNFTTTSSTNKNIKNPLTTVNNNTSDTTATAITKLGNRRQHRRQRQLQNGSTSTSTSALLQDFIVSGSMISTITNVRQEAATNDNTSTYNNTLTITYNQMISYKIYEPTYPNLSNSMTGPENYKILSSSEYIVVPFANSTANTELVLMLQKKLPLIFNTIIQPITIPTIGVVDNGGGGVVPPTQSEKKTPNTKSNIFLIAGIIIGVIGLLVIVVYLYCCMCKNNRNNNGKRGGDDSNSEDNSSGDNDNDNSDNSNKKEKTIASGTKPETISRLSIARMFGPTGGGAAPSTTNPPEPLLDPSVFDNDSQYTSSTNAHTSTAAAAAAAATAAYNRNRNSNNNNDNDTSNSSDDNNNNNTNTRSATLGISPNTTGNNNNNAISNSDPSSLFAKKQISQPLPSQSQGNKNGYVSSPSSTAMQSPLTPAGGHVINGVVNKKGNGGITTGTDTGYNNNKNTTAAAGTTTTTREQNNSIGFNNDNNYNDDSDNGGEWSVGAQTNIGSITGLGGVDGSQNSYNNTKQSSNWRDGNDTTKLAANGLMPPSTGGGNNNNGTATNNNNTTKSNEYVVYAPSGKLGIVVDNPDDDSGPIIYAIKETSPLLDSQLNVGDRLIMVDEINVTKMAPALISKLISKRANNPMRKLTLLQTSNYDDNEIQEERMLM